VEKPEGEQCVNLGVYGKMILKMYLLRSWVKRAVDNEQKRKQKQPETAQILLHRPFLGLTRCGKHEMLTFETN